MNNQQELKKRTEIFARMHIRQTDDMLRRLQHDVETWLHQWMLGTKNSSEVKI